MSAPRNSQRGGIGVGVAFGELLSTPGSRREPWVTAGTPQYTLLPRTLVNISTSSTSGTSLLALVPPESLGEGQRSRWARVSPPWGVPIPPLGHSHGPVPCCTEIPLGKGQHGACPHVVPKLLTTISLQTLHDGGAGGTHLRSELGGAGHSHHRTVDVPRASTHLGFPIQLLGHGGGCHSHGHSG